MPQKMIFQRPPLLTLHQVPLNLGCFRTTDPRVSGLYQQILNNLDHPETWQGAFELSCLLFDKPTAQLPAIRILESLQDLGGGDNPPEDFQRQLQIARAALAVAEYTSDKEILRKLSQWCRWTEINWDLLISQSRLRISPADMMDFLVRFYQMTGLKPVLRLCARLRSGAMDWTSILHGFGAQKRRPEPDHQSFDDDLAENRLDENDFETRCRIISHGELLADGMRYAAFSALFSGNGQEITAGKSGWKTIKKNHYALCGGTTGAPFLSGTGSEEPVSLTVLSAWAEAFSAQLYLGDAEWAVDELVRIWNNGFSYAVSRQPAVSVQYVNCIHPDSGVLSVHTLSRAAHAMSVIYRYALTVSKTQIRYNFPIQGEAVFHGGKTRLVLQENGLIIQKLSEQTKGFMFFVSAAETRKICIKANGEEYSGNQLNERILPASDGKYYSFQHPAKTGDEITYGFQSCIIKEETHHQGLCFLINNQLLSISVQPESWRFSADALPEIGPNGEICLVCSSVPQWKEKKGQPAGIPVLPKRSGTAEKTMLLPYSKTSLRITMIPKAENP